MDVWMLLCDRNFLWRVIFCYVHFANVVDLLLIAASEYLEYSDVSERKKESKMQMNI